MNQEQLLGQVRHLLTAAGAVLVTKGYADNNTIEAVVGAVLAIVQFWWSHHSKITPPAAPKTP